MEMGQAAASGHPGMGELDPSQTGKHFSVFRLSPL